MWDCKSLERIKITTSDLFHGPYVQPIPWTEIRVMIDGFGVSIPLGLDFYHDMKLWTVIRSYPDGSFTIVQLDGGQYRRLP